MKVFRLKNRFLRHLRSFKTRKFLVVLALLLQFALFRVILDISQSIAETPLVPLDSIQAFTGSPAVPKEYGEIIYQSNPESPRQVYVVGVEHRDALTRCNGVNTSKVQGEVYKIGEWLVLNKGLGLLVPEGFFSRKTGKTVLIRTSLEANAKNLPDVDFAEVEKKLADNTVYVNAEMLLRQYYGLRTRQVENQELYEAVHTALSRLSVTGKTRFADILPLKSEIDSLQEQRVAAMLQNIPAIVIQEFDNHNIDNQTALFTIGVSHLGNIIRFLEQNRITIPTSSQASGKKEYSADLNLSTEQFGVTVIVPKKLADDNEVMKMTHLEKLIDQCRKENPSSSIAQLSPY